MLYKILYNLSSPCPSLTSSSVTLSFAYSAPHYWIPCYPYGKDIHSSYFLQAFYKKDVIYFSERE